MMRECHPDLSHDEESVEFSTVINEIYEVGHVLFHHQAVVVLLTEF